MVLEGGNFNSQVNIEILDSEGDWEMIPGENPIILAPDSFQNITFRCTVPLDAQEDEEYYLEYEFQSGFETRTEDVRVIVDFVRFTQQPIIGGSGGIGVVGSDPGLSHYVFIPEAIIVVSVILFFIVVRRSKKSNNKEEVGT
jgi:hypothetical protein